MPRAAGAEGWREALQPALSVEVLFVVFKYSSTTLPRSIDRRRRSAEPWRQIDG
jgi:hypothetical protein